MNVTGNFERKIKSYLGSAEYVGKGNRFWGGAVYIILLVKISICLSFLLSLGFRYRDGFPINLIRLSTNTIEAIHDSLVWLSLAFIRFIPYTVLAWPNLPSIGLRSPGLM